MKDIGRAIRNRRKALGLTQRELAALAGCSELFVVDLEAGKATIRVDKLLDVLATIGLQIRLEPGKERIVVDSSL